MDVISLLRTPWVVVKKATLEDLKAKAAEANYAKQEVLKGISDARKELHEVKESYRIATERLTSLHQDMSAMESTALSAEETKVLACAQLETLKEEVEYLRDQVKIYQTRLGLLPQERQGQTDGKKLEPIQRSRKPFAVVQREMTNGLEEYWRKRAEAADPDAGSTGKTSTNTPTVSDGDSA